MMKHEPVNKRPTTRWLALSDVATHYGMTSETIRLWVTRGVRVRGQHLKLEARWIAGRWLTRRRWVREFIRAISAARGRRFGQTAAAEREAAAKRLGATP